MGKSSHYPSYDVWEQHAEWDEHTRKIVGKRRTPEVAHLFFNHQQALLVQTAAAVLIDDQRLEVLAYIAQQLDETVHSPIGEDQRIVGIPEKQELYRLGLDGMEEVSQQLFHTPFAALKKEQQAQVLSTIERGEGKERGAWTKQTQKAFFKKLLYDTVSAYYSHPLIWSEIGYGGPAYPRGYVRVEKGLVDPWEAKRNGK
jgi:hypothetical protein